MIFKQWRNLAFCALLVTSGVVTASAQNYSIDWYKVAGGGGTSTGGTYQVSGTIGQHDAGGPMTGGGYSLSGGFWSLYAVAMPGVPPLFITKNGPSTVLIWWLPGTGSFTLQTNGNAAISAWTSYAGAISSNGGTNSLTITPPKGNLFFRLQGN